MNIWHHVICVPACCCIFVFFMWSLGRMQISLHWLINLDASVTPWVPSYKNPSICYWPCLPVLLNCCRRIHFSGILHLSLYTLLPPQVGRGHRKTNATACSKRHISVFAEYLWKHQLHSWWYDCRLHSETRAAVSCQCCASLAVVRMRSHRGCHLSIPGLVQQLQSQEFHILFSCFAICSLHLPSHSNRWYCPTV